MLIEDVQRIIGEYAKRHPDVALDVAFSTPEIPIWRKGFGPGFANATDGDTRNPVFATHSLVYPVLGAVHSQLQRQSSLPNLDSITESSSLASACGMPDVERSVSLRQLLALGACSMESDPTPEFVRKGPFVKSDQVTRAIRAIWARVGMGALEAAIGDCITGPLGMSQTTVGAYPRGPVVPPLAAVPASERGLRFTPIPECQLKVALNRSDLEILAASLDIDYGVLIETPTSTAILTFVAAYGKLLQALGPERVSVIGPRDDLTLYTNSLEYCQFVRSLFAAEDSSIRSGPLFENHLSINNQVHAGLGWIVTGGRYGNVAALYEEQVGSSYLVACCPEARTALVVMMNVHEAMLCKDLAKCVFGEDLAIFPWLISPEQYVLRDGSPKEWTSLGSGGQESKNWDVSGRYSLEEISFASRAEFPRHFDIETHSGDVLMISPGVSLPGCPCMWLGEGRLLGLRGVLTFQRSGNGETTGAQLGLAARYKRASRWACQLAS